VNVSEGEVHEPQQEISWSAEGPATGHKDTGFLGFVQVALLLETARFSLEFTNSVNSPENKIPPH
jgi:hypothetical protein